MGKIYVFLASVSGIKTWINSQNRYYTSADIVFVCLFHYSAWRKLITNIIMRTTMLHGKNFGVFLPAEEKKIYLMLRLRTVFQSTSHCHGDKEHPSERSPKWEKLRNTKYYERVIRVLLSIQRNKNRCVNKKIGWKKNTHTQHV